MRGHEVAIAQQRLLDSISGRISSRLSTTVHDAQDADGPNLAVVLRERNCTVRMEIPVEVLTRAAKDPGALEALRIRLKGRRDRMMFRRPPAPLPKHIAPLSSFGTDGPRGGFRPRGRR